MIYILFTLCLFIAACANTISGGDVKFFNGPLKNGRIIGVLISTFAFAGWVLFNHLNPYLIIAYSTGVYFWRVWPWGTIFSCATWSMRLKFFARMLISAVIFYPLACIKYHDFYHTQTILSALGCTLIFSFLSTVIYWWYNNVLNIKYRGDDKLDYAEFFDGILVIELSILACSNLDLLATRL